jgi:hypothetical protein
MVNAHILNQSEKAPRGCDYEQYSKEAGKMVCCGADPIAKIGNNYVCIEHVVDLLAYGKAYNMYDVAPSGAKFGKKIDFKEDFLELCKSEHEKRGTK